MRARDRAEREDQRLSLLWLDIDEFKQINDTEGHDTGDVALRHVADCLREQLRGYDLAGRWGGDEFLVMLYPSNDDRMQRVAERLRGQVANNVDVCGQPITVSVGGYCAEGAEPLSQILARADRALYWAKEMGRNRVCLHRDAGETD